MKLATLRGGHPTDCTGCPACSSLAAAILANPTNPILIEAMGRPALRTLAEQALREETIPPASDQHARIRQMAAGTPATAGRPALPRTGFAEDVRARPRFAVAAELIPPAPDQHARIRQLAAGAR